jgi:hypothetical protein
MTEREACERLVAQGHCIGVDCGDCPLWGEWDCTGLDVVTLAKMWLRLHPCEKKLVFSAEKFYADKEIPDRVKQHSALDGWPERCDGKTEEECNALGYWVHPDQMEEIRNEEHPMYDLVKEHVQNILRAIDPIREDNTRRYIDCQVTMIVRKLKGLDCTGMEEDCAKYERRIALEDYE